MSDLPLRPGITLGPYPEREEPGIGALERFVSRTQGLLRQRVETGAAGYRQIVKRVERHGLALRGRSDARLQAYARELRVHLRRRGLAAELMARAFALVREVSERELGMRHFDVQIIGGWAIANGMLAEMETGEGKTLTATLPACAAALAGIPVHVVTVNDYLVTRDAEWMRPVYEALGVSVGTITEEMDAETRRASYACDVTYCSNKQLAFDYLKDRLVLGNEPGRLRLEMETLYSDAPRLGRLLLRGLCFAIVDEADSVLVDEARTPLIISRPGDTTGQREVYEQALALAEQLKEGVDYEIDARDRHVRFNHRGTFKLAQMSGDLGGLWTGRKRREELVGQALSALNLFKRDQQYLVRDGKVLIIDEYTGRVMPDRAWERGLHQMIETKEGVEITGQKDTLARISYQRFFRRYLRLGGMTGTAREVAAELWSVYRLKVVKVPPNRPVRRRRRPDKLFHSSEARWRAVVDAIGELHARRRPVLVGTRSVEASEHLSALLDAAGLPHQVLNARQDEEEAAVVECAGELRRITVATNMAGRGTDIRLAPGVQSLGGLHVIATERHDARRIDRQLYGRCARQGDRGSIETLVSCEDELFKVYCPKPLAALYRLLVPTRRPLSGWLARMIVRIPQRSAERRHARTRRQLLEMDERLGDALAFSGRAE